MSNADAVDRIVGQWNVERPELDTEPMEILGRMNRITRAVGDRQEAAYGRLGIGRGEFDVLATLRRSGEPYVLSPKELAASTMLTTGGMTGRLDKLERMGLIGRSPDPYDRRGLRVGLTDRGRAIVDEAVVAGLEAQSAVLAGLSAADRRRLAALLRDVLAAADS